LLPTASLTAVTPKQATPTAIERLSASTGFSRFPVKKADGTFAGYVHLKDTLAVQGAEREVPIARKDLRQLVTIRSGSTLRSALTTMQRTGSHLAQVTNGKGETIGIVTLEDVLEELVGEIRGEIRTSKQSLARDA
jgi:CBS domain containing-hemolysin-like protein